MARYNTIKNKKGFWDDIQKDAEDYAKNIARIMAMDIADEMTDVARSAIETFYGEYDPEDASKHNGRVYYYRHWNFEKSFMRYYKNRDPKFYGGIKLLMEDFPDEYRGTNSNPPNVFWRVYAGYHGIASFQSAKGSIACRVPIMKPAPMTLINERFDYIVSHLKEYENKAAEKAKECKYKYIF